MAVLALVWCAVAAPGPASSRLPEAAARAVERVSPDDLRHDVGTLASRRVLLGDARAPELLFLPLNIKTARHG